MILRPNITPGDFYLPKAFRMKAGGKVESLAQRSQALQSRIKPKYAEGGEVDLPANWRELQSEGEVDLPANWRELQSADEVDLPANGQGAPATTDIGTKVMPAGGTDDRNPYLTAAMRGVANLAGTPADIAGLVGDVIGAGVNAIAPAVGGKSRSEWLNEKMSEYFPNLARARNTAVDIVPTSENIKRAMGVEKRPEGFIPSAIEGAITYATPSGIGKALLRSVAPGAVAGAIGEAGEALAGETGRAIGEIGSLTLPSLARGAGRAINPAYRKARNIVSGPAPASKWRPDELPQVEAGYVIPPETTLMKDIFAGQGAMYDKAIERNQQATDKLFRKDLDLEEGAHISRERVSEEIAKGHNALEKLKDAQGTIEFNMPEMAKSIKEMNKLLVQNPQLLDNLPKTDKETLLQAMGVGKGLGTQSAVDMYRKLLAVGNANVKSKDYTKKLLGVAQQGLASHYEDAITRAASLARDTRTGKPNTQLLEDIKKGFRKIRVGEIAKGAVSGGKIDATKLTPSLTGNARGDAVETAIDFAIRHPNMVAAPGHKARFDIDKLSRYGGGATSAALYLAGLAGAPVVGGAAILGTVRPITRTALLSNKAQLKELARQVSQVSPTPVNGDLPWLRMAAQAASEDEPLTIIPITTRGMARGGRVEPRLNALAKKFDRILTRYPALLEKLEQAHIDALRDTFSQRDIDAKELAALLRQHGKVNRKSKDKSLRHLASLQFGLAAHFANGGLV